MDFSLLMTIGVIHFLALMSPGPDFVIIVKNSLTYSRKIGIITAVGLGIGIIFHVLYTLLGIGIILSKNESVFRGVQVAGGLYLIYIGIASIRSTFNTGDQSDLFEVDEGKDQELSHMAALRMGFLTNVLNPKATLYFVSIFTQFIKPTTPKLMQIAVGAEVVILTGLYFAILSVLISSSKVKSAYLRFKTPLERFLGVVLILLGLKVMLF